MELSDPEVGHVTTGCGVVLVGICCLSVIQPETLCLVTSLQAFKKQSGVKYMQCDKDKCNVRARDNFCS